MIPAPAVSPVPPSFPCRNEVHLVWRRGNNQPHVSPKPAPVRTANVTTRADDTPVPTGWTVAPTACTYREHKFAPPLGSPSACSVWLVSGSESRASGGTASAAGLARTSQSAATPAKNNNSRLLVESALRGSHVSSCQFFGGFADQLFFSSHATFELL